MNDLQFEVLSWIAPAYGDEEVRATSGALRITASEKDVMVTLTEVDDTIGKTVRPHVHVPLVSMATWLLANWWRLRWEGKPRLTSSAWRQVHCLSGIGGDDVWPDLEFSSDGDFIDLRMAAESNPDVAAVRFLRDVSLDVPAKAFEAAVERFVSIVETRLSTIVPGYRGLSELRSELNEERISPGLSRKCKWQAIAGIDPGDAPNSWIDAVESLAKTTGPRGGEEILSVVPEFRKGINDASNVIDAMRQSTTQVNLSWVVGEPQKGQELPWQRGARLARELRKKLDLSDGLVSDAKLSELLSVPLPLPVPTMRSSPLIGGYRNGEANARTKIIWHSARRESQRFFLARVIGAANVLTSDEHLIPVTECSTALQKLERSFAQEFLCPWEVLDAFTDEHGLDDESLMDAAEHFAVSDWVVRSTLVNRGKIARDRLPSVS